MKSRPLALLVQGMMANALLATIFLVSGRGAGRYGGVVVVVTPGGTCGDEVADGGVVVRGVLPGMAWPAPWGWR